MSDDWQDSSFQDRHHSGAARQRQPPKSSQAWEDASQQDGQPEMRGHSTTQRRPANQSSSPMPPRQSRPQGGSSMPSQARRGSGPSGLLLPRDRSPRQIDPMPTDPRGPGSREMPPEPRHPRDQLPGAGYHAPTLAAGGLGRHISAPRERSRHVGGSLLSFAQAASSAMRAIVTGKRRATRPERPAAMLEGVSAGMPGEETPRPHRRYRPYKRSRVRLVIHKRQERRQVRGQKLLVSGMVSSFLLLLAIGASVYGGSNVYAFYGSTQQYLGALADPNGFPLTTRIYDRNGVLLYEMYRAPNSDNPNDAYRFYDQYGQIPQNVKNATVDIEDKTFWTNNGVDILGILRAGVNNVSNSGGTQGGSTITQQLINVSSIPLAN